MSNKRRALLAGSVVALAGLAVALVLFLRGRALSSPTAMLARLPGAEGIILYIDFSALRRGGILQLLAGSKMSEEPEYQAFINKSGFNYQRDLDAVMASFQPSAVFFLVRGRFDWKRLSGYVREQGGGCAHEFCRMPGSAPERRISFFPLRSNVMALAVSTDDSAAARLKLPARTVPQVDLPDQPLWLLVPPAALKRSPPLPAGTRLFAKALEEAERIVLSLGPQGKKFEARLDVLCHSSQEARVLVNQLEGLTLKLRELIAEAKQKPNPRDLSGVLTAGVFKQEDRRVVGRWPVERVFLEALAGSS